MPTLRRRTAAAPLHLIDQIVMRGVGTLTVNPRNSRTHSPGQVATIVASIKRFGFTMPLMVDGEGMVIAGHGRLLAAQQLELAQVPTIDGSYLTPEERSAYVIADNQIALTADWDLDMLSSELDLLGAAGFDLSEIGFDDAALAKLRGETELEAAAPRKDRAESPIVQYNIVFDDDAQQQLWFGLLRRLKQQHPDLPTIGARLAAFIEESRPSSLS